MTGRVSNRALTRERIEFRRFVELHRSPTGRTLQADGRYHGAIYHLFSQFLCIKQQTGIGRKVLPSYAVLSSSFAAACASIDLKAPCNTTVATWFKEDFNRGSALYHTTLFPHQTDSCSTCCALNTHQNSVEASLRKHRLHVEDQGSLERQAATKELHEEYDAIAQEIASHRKLAGEAQECHKVEGMTARADYIAACAAYLDVASSGRLACTDQVDHFCRLASRLKFCFDSDYQQDKSYPHWGKSPQPGPTYFFSKITNYVHLIVAGSCGISSEPTNFGRNEAY